jgi:hypothetical protein
MIEYPSIIPCAKAPRETCIAFDKLDGSNIRFQWSPTKGFHLFGTRTKIMDLTTPIYGFAITYFMEHQSSILDKLFHEKYKKHNEIIVFGELYGPNSFAGIHDVTDTLKVTVFDILVGHKNRFFIPPQELMDFWADKIEIPAVVYTGELNDAFIQSVRESTTLNEGVIVKGTTKNGAFRGNMWQCKIKTNAYLQRIYAKFGDDGLKKYGE